MSKSLEDRLAEIGDEAEAGEEDQTVRPLPPHVQVSRPGHARSKVLQVRLNPEEMAALEAIAERRELPVSTVAREQILRLLADSDPAIANQLLQLLDAYNEATDRASESAAALRQALAKVGLQARVSSMGVLRVPQKKTPKKLAPQKRLPRKKAPAKRTP